MPNPAWFIADHYAAQKVEQMNATSYEMGENGWFTLNKGDADVWTLPLYQRYLEQYRLPDGSSVTDYENFQVCNQGDYGSSITLADVNVSPNPLFNINVYLQNLASYNNANTDAVEGDAPAGGWTAQNELTTIFNTYHSSVWNHYNTAWDTILDVNPSNGFDTQAYLQLRAEAMGDGATVADAVAAIKAANLNPIQDFYEWGQLHNITTAPAVDAGQQTAEIPNWNPWQEGGVSPEETDPYDVNVVPVAIMAGEYEYKGVDGENNRFDAKFMANSAESTLNAKDVIDGGTGMNTLAVEFGRDWDGFNGVTVADQFELNPSVTNVGRVVLNHTENTANRDLSFNAKNISDDTVRYDLNGSGKGSISLSELGDKVQQINISNIESAGTDGTATTTQLQFALGAFAGKEDTLTIGVKDVSAGTGPAHVITSDAGIENLTIDALGGNNNIDITGIEGVKALTLTGAAALYVDAPSTVKSYDASTTTGGVNLSVNGITNQTIQGGLGVDRVTIQGGTTVSKANWTSIEQLSLAGNGASTVNLKGVNGIDTVILASGGNEVNHLDAMNLTVHDAGETTSNTIKGDIGNLAWFSNGEKADTEVKAQLESNATGNVTIKTIDEQLLGDSTFTLNKATGKITFDLPNAAEGVSKITINAEEATGLEVTVAGSMTIQGDLSSTETVVLNLTDEGSGDEHDAFTLSTSLDSAESITVNGGYEDVVFGSIGSNESNSLVLKVNEATNFTAGAILTGPGSNITLNIAAEEEVTLDSIEATANDAGKNRGDVTLNVSGENLAASGESIAIIGNQLTINLSNLEASKETPANGALDLTATSSIRFSGSAEADDVTVSGVGAGSSSQINLGEGTDRATISTLSLSKTTSVATINVNLGDDSDADTVSVATATKGYTVARISNFDSGTDVLEDFAAETDWETFNTIMTKAGLSIKIEDGDLNDSGFYVHSGTAYAVAGAEGAAAIVMITGDGITEDFSGAAGADSGDDDTGDGDTGDGDTGDGDTGDGDTGDGAPATEMLIDDTAPDMIL